MKSICPYCKTQEYTKQYSTFDIFDNDYELVKCHACKAYFLTPNPSDSLLKQAYDDSYYGLGDEEEKFESFIEKGVNFFRRRRAKRIAKLANNQGRVLDIGCGNGKFLSYVRTFGNIDIFGTEMEGRSARRAAKIKDINLKIGELSEKDYPKMDFDVVTMFHVFEHLKEPSRYLDLIDKKLKPNGYLIMSFPNIDSWQAHFFKAHWLHLDPPRHLFFFKPDDLIEIMQNRGFDLISEKYVSIEQNPFGAVQSWLNLVHVKREILFESLKGNFDYTEGTHSLILFFERFLFMFFTPLFILIDFVASIFRKGATVELAFKKR